jgi:hypothetical protein
MFAGGEDVELSGFEVGGGGDGGGCGGHGEAGAFSGGSLGDSHWGLLEREAGNTQRDVR